MASIPSATNKQTNPQAIWPPLHLSGLILSALSPLSCAACFLTVSWVPPELDRGAYSWAGATSTHSIITPLASSWAGSPCVTCCVTSLALHIVYSVCKQVFSCNALVVNPSASHQILSIHNTAFRVPKCLTSFIQKRGTLLTLSFKLDGGGRHCVVERTLIEFLCCSPDFML